MTTPNDIEPSKKISPSQPNFWFLVISFTAVLFTLLFFAGVGKANQTAVAPSPQSVEVMQVVVETTYKQASQSIGVVESSARSNVGFELSGQLRTILVDEGQRVEANQVIAVLDTTRLKAQRNELIARLDSALAQAKLSALTAKRVESLVEQNLESGQRLDETSAQLTAANARVSEIKAGITTIDVELEKSLLKAPFSGVIAQRFVDQGTVINAGEPVLTVTADTQLEARFSLPANMSQSLVIGEQLMLNHNQRKIKGEVRAILPQRALSTRTVDVMIALDTSETDVLPGDILTATLEKEHQQQGVWVPVSALSNGLRGLWTLYVVTHEGEDKLASRSVEVIYTNGQKAFVRGALSEQDFVVMSGTHRLVPNQQVLADAIKSTVTTG